MKPADHLDRIIGDKIKDEMPTAGGLAELAVTARMNRVSIRKLHEVLYLPADSFDVSLGLAHTEIVGRVVPDIGRVPASGGPQTNASHAAP